VFSIAPRDRVLRRSVLFLGTLIRLGPCSCNNCNAPSPPCFLASCRLGDFLFHDPQDSGHGYLNRSRTLWSDLFDADRSCLYRPILPLPYSTMRRVVVATGAAEPHITRYAVRILATLSSHRPVSLPPLLYDNMGLVLKSHESTHPKIQSLSPRICGLTSRVPLSWSQLPTTPVT